jgi:glycosyltransferase involved in cell wall biosynthesis
VPTIAIDCRFAKTHSGLGRFTRELVAALIEVAPPDASLLLIVRPGQTPWWPQGTTVPITMVDCDVPHYSLTEQIALPRFLARHPADVFLAPHFNAPIALTIPSIVTVHDLILHRYPNQASFPRQLAYRFLMRLALWRAASVLAVSPFVGRELAATYGPRIAAKSTVIGEGVASNFSPRSEVDQTAVRRKYNLERRFLLYVGNAKQHKNVQGLLDAFTATNLPDTDLVAVCGGPEGDRLRWPPQTIRLTNVPEADLPALYSAAAACVTLSRYEGYCLPLVEALACGCPVVAPALSAIPDIIGTAPGAHLVANGDPALFIAALRQLPNRPAPVHLHSWDEPARAVWSVIREALLARRSA